MDLTKGDLWPFRSCCSKGQDGARRKALEKSLALRMVPRSLLSRSCKVQDTVETAQTLRRPKNCQQLRNA